MTEITHAIYITNDIYQDGEIIARRGDIFHDGNKKFYIIIDGYQSYRMYTYKELIAKIANGQQP